MLRNIVGTTVDFDVRVPGRSYRHGWRDSDATDSRESSKEGLRAISDSALVPNNYFDNMVGKQ
jgi:hypothetical protein